MEPGECQVCPNITLRGVSPAVSSQEYRYTDKKGETFTVLNIWQVYSWTEVWKKNKVVEISSTHTIFQYLQYIPPS